MSIVCIGVDIGQQRDPTAIVVCEYERVEIDSGGVPQDPTGLRDLLNIATGVEDAPLYDTRYVIRALQRMPLKTTYPAIARHIGAVSLAMRRRDPTGDCYLAIDATGVGRPVVDVLRDELEDDVHLTAVTISGSDKCPSAPLFRTEMVMGKVWMVSRLQALIQTQRLVMPKTDQAAALGTELVDFEIRVTKAGHDELGAFKVGTHDDLVTALGLSVLGDAHSTVRYGPSLYR